jgi:hypothetical protein
MISMTDIKTSLFCFEAKRWVGVMQEGHNGGQIIAMFQRAVDHHADGEPWCMAFVQYCITMTERAFQEIYPKQPFQGPAKPGLPLF